MTTQLSNLLAIHTALGQAIASIQAEVQQAAQQQQFVQQPMQQPMQQAAQQQQFVQQPMLNMVQQPVQTQQLVGGGLPPYSGNPADIQNLAAEMVQNEQVKMQMIAALAQLGLTDMGQSTPQQHPAIWNAFKQIQANFAGGNGGNVGGVIGQNNSII